MTESRKISPCADADYFKRELNYKEMAISLGIVNSRVLCGDLPEYPKKLKSRNISGEATVQITINEVGEVSAASFLSGNKLFSKSAQEASYRTKFEPVVIGGKPRRTFGVLIYEFESDGETSLKTIE